MEASSVLDLQTSSRTAIHISPKFRLGKILSKYLIIDIISYSGFLESATQLLSQSSVSLKRLLIENY